jgi:hypothetical protein
MGFVLEHWLTRTRFLAEHQDYFTAVFVCFVYQANFEVEYNV